MFFSSKAFCFNKTFSSSKFLGFGEFVRIASSCSFGITKLIFFKISSSKWYAGAGFKTINFFLECK
ncbi:hypothetical protein SCLARK_00731 [Spiroplasma clarkii]|nr:hypothetical protein SCLARK_00731 [Spiroplasma clarkii]